MKKLILGLIGIIVGIFVIPALFAFAIGIGGTIIGLIAQPKIMLGLIAALGVISLPGIILGVLVKK